MTELIELHGARTGNCLRAAIALEESGLPFEIHPVDLRSAAHRARGFLALNPHGKVPVLIDRRGGRDLVLTQSNAIMLHVAASAPDRLAPFTAGRQTARFLERLFYFVTDVIAPSHAAFQLGPTGDTSAMATLQRRSLANLVASERFLEDSPFMVGHDFSVVDIAAVTIAAAQGSLPWLELPLLKAWFERVMARPAVVRGLGAFDAF